MKTSNGQTVLIDATFAALIFVLLFLALNNNFIVGFETEQTKGELSEMSLLANSSLDLLVKSSGIPENWEYIGIADVNQIGLANHKRQLAEQKVNAFKNLASDYNTTKALIGLQKYDYYFVLESTPQNTAGLPPQSDATKVVAQRIVTFQGAETRASLTVYKIE